jgi:hypothetical protein
MGNNGVTITAHNHMLFSSEGYYLSNYVGSSKACRILYIFHEYIRNRLYGITEITSFT